MVQPPQPGITAGDVVIVVEEKPHVMFTRDGHDLAMEMEIELVEALCGFTRTITHLDNRVIAIHCPAGDVVAHGMDVYGIVCL